MRREFIPFMAGMVVGIVIGVAMDEEDKKKIQNVLNQRTKKLRKEYERSIREGVIKMKRFVKAHLH